MELGANKLSKLIKHIPKRRQAVANSVALILPTVEKSRPPRRVGARVGSSPTKRRRGRRSSPATTRSTVSARCVRDRGVARQRARAAPGQRRRRLAVRNRCRATAGAGPLQARAVYRCRRQGAMSHASVIGIPPHKWATPIQVKELDDATTPKQPPMRSENTQRYDV